MSSEIINYLRNTNDIGLINRIIQELNKNQPEVKGDAIQARIPKVSELYEVKDTVTSQEGGALLLEDGTSFLLTETSAKIYKEVTSQA